MFVKCPTKPRFVIRFYYTTNKTPHSIKYNRLIAMTLTIDKDLYTIFTSKYVLL